jgi:hypothetical protein
MRQLNSACTSESSAINIPAITSNASINETSDKMMRAMGKMGGWEEWEKE